MPQDALPSQRNEQNRRVFPPIDLRAMGAQRHRPRKRTMQYSRAPVINREAAAYWIPAFASMTMLRWETQCLLPTQVLLCRPKILWLQFDWRTVRGAIGGVVPGIAIAVQGIGCRDAFGGDQSLQRRQPVAVIGLASIGIAVRLRALAFVGKGSGPFVPGK